MLKVLKFGGTSVGSLERIDNVVEIVKKIKDEGHEVIVVVSAMSGETNKLIDFAEHYTKNPKPDELDMLLSSGERVTSALLSIALNEKGYDTISMSGGQAGIYTDDLHTKARIDHIDTTHVKSTLKDNKIIIIAGFQGVSIKSGRITTLGRGGSDLTAVAIAGAIEADVCEIYTDVDGIYTTDPRIVPQAKKLNKISYEEMLELASSGAKVLQTRSVEMAKKLNVNLISRSSFTPEVEGTYITKEDNIMEKPIVSGIALDRDQIRVGLYGVTDKPGIAARFFGALAEKNVNVDMIVQTVATDGRTNIDFTIPSKDLNSCKEVVDTFKEDTLRIDFNEEVCKVSIVGVGMKSHTGVASKAFLTLAKENINIRIISTSEIKISMVIEEKYAELAVRALHEAYKLDK